MATNCVFILLMMILACTFIHTHSTVGKTKPLNGFKEYAAKPKGTIRTMKWQGRDLVDCVDIYKQPSMNNHLLKNHIIQLVPDSFPPNSLIKRNVSHSNSYNELENEQCPNGSIPIRRPLKDELVRATIQPSRYSNRSKVNDPPAGVHKYAVVSQESGYLYTGLAALFNIWKPITEHATFSLAQLWATFGNVEVVEAGWMVYPEKFGDGEPRFFIYYTNDAYTTGCYNHDCEGFVQISRRICLGCVLRPQSTYQGEQSEVDIGISQNPFDKAWWIRYNHELVGYYPKELFSRLSRGGATSIKWGGEVTQLPGQGPSLNQMGSGHFPVEGLRKAAFFADLKYEANNMIRTPIDANVQKFVTHPHCYDLSQLFVEGQGQYRKSHFFYGGPGASAPGCVA